MLPDDEPYWLFGLHSVRAALANPRRRVRRLLATRNALARLEPLPAKPAPETVDVRALSRLLGDVVHQGVAILVDPLRGQPIEALREASAVLLLDHITDPHNVGAILRSAAAFRVDGMVTTSRHSASETGVLAKSASGALDLVDVTVVVNLTRAVEALQGYGFQVAALDSEAPVPVEELTPGPKWAFVLGAEGKGVRPGVAAACDARARIEVPGALASLNVSNAAAIALYAMRRHLVRV